MKIKRKPADIAFSKCIRERAGWRCEACFRQFKPNSASLQCSHFFSRRHRTVRWHPDNAAAHCFSCHLNFTGNPIEFSDWIKEFLGEDKLNDLIKLKNRKMKITKKDEKEIAAHYRKQLLKMTGPDLTPLKNWET